MEMRQLLEDPIPFPPHTPTHPTTPPHIHSHTQPHPYPPRHTHTKHIHNYNYKKYIYHLFKGWKLKDSCCLASLYFFECIWFNTSLNMPFECFESLRLEWLNWISFKAFCKQTFIFEAMAVGFFFYVTFTIQWICLY